MSKRILVTGAGGFIGGHLVKRLLDEGNEVRAVDVKPLDKWWQKHELAENISADCSLKEVCDSIVKDKSQIFNLACFDKETEVWTSSGWKLFKDLQPTDAIATLSKSGYLEWQTPTKYIEYQYQGTMYSFQAKTIDICVTPNHNMYVSDHKYHDLSLKRADECISDNIWMKRGLSWVGKNIDIFKLPDDTLRPNATKKITEFAIRPFLKFLGYYLSEGSCSINKKKRNYRIHLSNYHPEIIEDMRSTVAELGFTPYFDTTTSHGITFQSKILVEYLYQFGHANSKFIPSEIKNLPPDLLKELFRTLMLGDGSSDRNVYYTTSKKLADDFGELCLKLGYTYTISYQKRSKDNHHDMHIVYFSENDKVHIRTSPTTYQYDDKVFCVEVPNGIIYVRRNGNPVWCGNCRMGGIGYIESNRAMCASSILITANLLEAARMFGVEKFLFSSSGCVYSIDKQFSDDSKPLSETDAYPMNSELGYGEEKFFSERLCQYYHEDFGIKSYVPRFFNIMGPRGSWDGGKEKSPAALCRKISKAKLSGNHEIEIWGDGSQKRNYTFITDCVEGILRLMESNFHDPINLGSSEQVTINQLADIIEDIAGIKCKRNYLLNAPKGVHARNTDNTLIKSVLGWEPTTPLREGLEKTYKWIEGEIKAGRNGE